MKRIVKYYGIISLLAAAGCVPARHPDMNRIHESCNSVYYWRTMFDLDSAESQFLSDHDVKRMYIRFFDVVSDDMYMDGYGEVVIPNATIQFRDTIPVSVESIVPTVFVTVDALRSIGSDTSDLANKIVRRVLNMASYHRIRNIEGIQLDCDWTESTQQVFFSLCRDIRLALHEKGDTSMLLSSTIRLHQLRQEVPPVDYGVLMVYNTGSFMNPASRNSILDYDDVEPYFRRDISYALPLDIAYPAYRWSLRFRDGRFSGIVRTDGITADSVPGETIRTETSDYATIMKVKNLISKRLVSDGDGHSNIIYHLDSENISTFTSDEINSIYSCAVH